MGVRLMATYVFKAEVYEEDDGRWSSRIGILPGCAAWGYSREEALEALQNGAELYVEDMLECGEYIPVEEIGNANELTIKVTITAVTA